MKKIVLVLLLMPLSLLSDGYWKLFDTTKLASEIVNIACMGEDNLVAIGTHCEIFGSTLNDFYTESFIRLSTDQGNTWRQIFSSRDDSVAGVRNEHLIFGDVTFQDSNTIIATVRRNSYYLPWYRLLTTNKGETWSLTPVQDESNTNIYIDNFSMLNPSIGSASGVFKIYSVEDSGRTFHELKGSDASGYYISEIQRIGHNTFFALTGNYTGISVLTRTTDYGATWVTHEMPTNTNSFYFLDENIGYFLQSGLNPADDKPFHELLYKTIDGGRTYEKVFENMEFLCLREVKFVDKDNGFLFGSDHFYHTIDGGNTWLKDTIVGRDEYGFIGDGNFGYNGKSAMYYQVYRGAFWKYYPQNVAVSEPVATPLLAVPTPFTDEARIEFDVEQAGAVSVLVRNSMGELVAQREYYSQSGRQSFSLAGAELSAGIYFCDIVANGKTYRAKAVLVK